MTSPHGTPIVEVPEEPPLLTPELARVLLRVLRRAETSIATDEDPDAIAS